MEFFLIVIIIVIPIAFYFKHIEDKKIKEVFLIQQQKRGGECIQKTILYAPKFVLKWDEEEVEFSCMQGSASSGAVAQSNGGGRIYGHLTPNKLKIPPNLSITINKQEKSLQQGLDKRLKIVKEEILFDTAFHEQFLLETSDTEMTKRIFSSIVPAQILKFPGKKTNQINIQIESGDISRRIQSRISISVGGVSGEEEIWDWLIETMELLYTRIKEL